MCRVRDCKNANNVASFLKAARGDTWYSAQFGPPRFHLVTGEPILPALTVLTREVQNWEATLNVTLNTKHEVKRLTTFIIILVL
jgi:hypothetical protein